MTSTQTQERIRQHTQQYKVAADQVQVVRFELRKLRELGALVDVDIDGINSLYTSTLWEELGVPENDKRRQKLGKGKKSLVPEVFSNKCVSLAVRVRQNLERYSYPLASFHPYRWIPVTAYFEWREKHEALCKELDDLIDSYDDQAAIEELKATMRDIANEAYVAILSRNGQFVEDFGAFASRLITLAIAKMPTKEVLKQRMRVSYKTAILEDTADIEARLAELDQKEIERTQLRCEAEKVREMHRLELEKARQQMEQITSPWDEMLKQFEAQFYQKVIAASEMIRKHGYLPGKTAESLKEARHLYDVLCVAKNERVEQALNQIESALASKPLRIAGQPERSYDVELVKSALGTVAAMLNDTVQSVTSVNEWTALEF